MKVKDCERRRFEVKEYENILSGLKGINWFHFKKSKMKHTANKFAVLDREMCLSRS